MNLDYVKEYRGLAFVKVGMKVEHSYSGKTKIGKITGGNTSGNIQVRFDGDKYSQNCHPTWAMRYYDENDNVIAEYVE